MMLLPDCSRHRAQKALYVCYIESCPAHDQLQFCIECSNLGLHKCYPMRQAGTAIKDYNTKWTLLKEKSEELNHKYKNFCQEVYPIIELL